MPVADTASHYQAIGKRGSNESSAVRRCRRRLRRILLERRVGISKRVLDRRREFVQHRSAVPLPNDQPGRLERREVIDGRLLERLSVRTSSVAPLAGATAAAAPAIPAPTSKTATRQASSRLALDERADMPVTFPSDADRNTCFPLS
ncbi:hypothetical protein [Natronorubrum sp. DTA7]|uniref:hypothetical protein n=1 Tax=Natronorubrum sp. DTA7 TaxID=3447016 RepID=UPI003F849000